MTNQYSGATGGWTDGRVETLKKLWLDGQSAAQIARALGGVSRNAVIGKVHRLGMVDCQRQNAAAPGGAKAARRDAAARPPRSYATQSTVKAVPAPPILEAIPEGVEPLPFDCLTRHSCRWPLGDPRDAGFGYCGRQVPLDDDGRPVPPYCANHAHDSRNKTQKKVDTGKLAGWADKMDGTRRSVFR